MNWTGWFTWGFVSTVVLTILLSVGQSTKMTRLNIPFILGSMFTPRRDRAQWIGIFLNLIIGLFFSFFYVAIFQSLQKANVSLGALIGFIHAIFVLTIILPNLSGTHPRMANEHYGPLIGKLIEPPGFMALNYGFATPLTMILSHVVFGMILGGFYRPLIL
jgi:hypothetical protein